MVIEHFEEVRDIIDLLTPYKPSILVLISHACYLKTLLPAEDRGTIDIRDVVVNEIKDCFFTFFSFLPSLSDWEWLCVLSNLF